MGKTGSGCLDELEKGVAMQHHRTRVYCIFDVSLMNRIGRKMGPHHPLLVRHHADEVMFAEENWDDKFFGHLKGGREVVQKFVLKILAFQR